MMRWHVAYRPGNYVLWAVEESKSGKVIGMINYHHRNLREKRALARLDDILRGLIAARRASGNLTSDLLSVLLRATDEDSGSGMSEIIMVRPQIEKRYLSAD